MVSQSQDVEILVHIAAPSRSRDDAVYRQLAQAYLAFEPEKVIALPESHDSFQDANIGVSRTKSQQTPPPRAHPSQDHLISPPIPFPDLQSQDLSFQSALDNRSSPVLPHCRLHNQQHVAQTTLPPSSSYSPLPRPLADVASVQSSWAPPSSEIGDSYPMPDASLFSTSPTKVFQRFLSQNKIIASSSIAPFDPSGTHASQEMSSLPLPGSSSLPLPAVKPPKRRAEQQDDNHLSSKADAGTVIPLTPLRSNLAAHAGNTTNQDPDSSVVNETTHIQSSLTSCPATDTSSRAVSEPPPSKRPRIGPGRSVESLSLVRSSSDGYQPPATFASSQVDSVHEIRPPSPPVGVAHVKPADFVSRKLAKLAADLSSRYRPINKRELEPLERGHWLVDCAGWSPKIRHDTWVFLIHYVGSGLAGWGVWCRRDASHGRIRLYCWGHIVKHTYLLLYLASGRQLKATGATWIDSGGDPVVQVLPHNKQS